MGHLDDEIKRLQGIIANIEGRVKALEERQFGGSQKKSAEELRMILIGPPGAGTLGSSPAPTETADAAASLTGLRSRGTQARARRPPGSRRSSTAATW